MSSTDIGVSFPEFDKKYLGSCIRVHGIQAVLINLMGTGWLKGLRDYTEQSEIQPTPVTTQYCLVKRIQTKSNVERLYRRSISKGSITEELAKEKISSNQGRTLNLPFLELQSSSTKQKFSLFIKHEPQEKAVVGKFNTYGLSNTATIPWF